MNKLSIQEIQINEIIQRIRQKPLDVYSNNIEIIRIDQLLELTRNHPNLYMDLSSIYLNLLSLYTSNITAVNQIICNYLKNTSLEDRFKAMLETDDLDLVQSIKSMLATNNFVYNDFCKPMEVTGDFKLYDLNNIAHLFLYCNVQWIGGYSFVCRQIINKALNTYITDMSYSKEDIFIKLIIFYSYYAVVNRVSCTAIHVHNRMDPRDIFEKLLYNDISLNYNTITPTMSKILDIINHNRNRIIMNTSKRKNSNNIELDEETTKIQKIA